MSLYLKIVLIILGLAYLISPVDIIPDLLLPFIGWIDDGVVLGTIVYLIRYGRLPNFLFKKKASSPHVSKTAHEILGIGPNASKKEIQAAYKEAVKKYHPDKVSHLGEEFSNLANEKFLEIQKAYDTLMKR